LCSFFRFHAWPVSVARVRLALLVVAVVVAERL
jgi:hypothetical protein